MSASLQPRPRSYDLIYSGTTWACAALILCAVIVALLLLVQILSRGKLRHKVYNQLLANIAVAAILFNLLLKLGTILHENGALEMSKWYCGIYLLLQKVEWLFMPLAIWMMSIDRILAIHKPQDYNEKMTRTAKAALIGTPWIFSTAFGLFILFILGSEVLTRYEWLPRDSKLYYCSMRYEHTVVLHVARLWDAFGRGIPVTALSITTIVLLMVAYAAYTRNSTIKVYNTKGELLVSTESIIFSLLLNLSAISILLDDALSAVFHRYPSLNTGFVLSHWAWSLLGVCIAVGAMSVLPDIKYTMRRLCCCCCASVTTKGGGTLVDMTEEVEVPTFESEALLPVVTPE